MVFTVLIVLMSFINLKLSVALYISHLILVPYLRYKIAGFPFTYTTVNFILLFVFLYQFLIVKKYRIDFQILNPFLFLFSSLLYLSFFTNGLPWNIQFYALIKDVIQTCFITFIVWNLALSEPKNLKYFKWALVISIIIAGTYGIFLMKMEGLNPYTSYLADYIGVRDAAGGYSNSQIRLGFSTASRIQSTMGHPMSWSLVLCFLMIIVSAIYIKTKDKILLILIGLIGLNILISGVRTGIASLFIGFIYIFFRLRNFKLIILTFLTLSIFTIFIQSNESLSNYFVSFTDISGNSSNVSGSSIGMRLSQLQGTIDEIKGNELAGKGYGWTGYYMSLYGAHPVILAFESLIYMVLCNSGYIGLLIWIIFFLLLLQLNRKILNIKTDIFLTDSFIIVFAAYAIGTGNYGYLPFFAIFYTFLLVYLKTNQQSEMHLKQSGVIKNKKDYIKFEMFRQ